MGERIGHDAGAFCWVGLATSDPAAASAFYTMLFGWRAEALGSAPVGSYTLLRRGGRDVAILYRQTPEARAAHAPPHWTSFISVEDVDATAARAGELGGEAVFRKPFDVGDEGRIAAIADPAGAIVSLWQARSRSGAGLLDSVGALCWNELVTPDVERAKSFYRDLLGWAYDVDTNGYTTISNAGRHNGGIREPSEQGNANASHWLPHFMVENADIGAGTVERGGGRRLAPTRETAIGRVAVVADPQGAHFALIEREPVIGAEIGPREFVR